MDLVQPFVVGNKGLLENRLASVSGSDYLVNGFDPLNGSVWYKIHFTSKGQPVTLTPAMQNTKPREPPSSTQKFVADPSRTMMTSPTEKTLLSRPQGVISVQVGKKTVFFEHGQWDGGISVTGHIVGIDGSSTPRTAATLLLPWAFSIKEGKPPQGTQVKFDPSALTNDMNAMEATLPKVSSLSPNAAPLPSPGASSSLSHIAVPPPPGSSSASVNKPPSPAGLQNTPPSNAHTASTSTGAQKAPPAIKPVVLSAPTPSFTPEVTTGKISLFPTYTKSDVTGDYWPEKMTQQVSAISIGNSILSKLPSVRPFRHRDEMLGVYVTKGPYETFAKTPQTWFGHGINSTAIITVEGGFMYRLLVKGTLTIDQLKEKGYIR